MAAEILHFDAVNDPTDSGLKIGPKSEQGSEDMMRGKAEIDTSAPFESVKEAANRFGGIGFWKPTSQKPSEVAFQNGKEMVDMANVEERAAELERELIVKERETLDVLKELEATKNIVEELKLKLQKEASEMNAALNGNTDDNTVNSAAEVGENLCLENDSNVHQNGIGVSVLCPSSAPGFILLELKQAKLNLSRTTSDLADIRATVDLYNKKIEKERMLLEKTRQRLSSNTTKILSVEEELNQTRQKMQMVNDNAGQVSSQDPLHIKMELQRLTSETEKFKNLGELARSEILKAMFEIEKTTNRIKTAGFGLIAAKKMNDAARAAEVMALAEIKVLSNSGNSSGAFHKNSEGVTITVEEYLALISRAREAEEACNGRIVNAVLQVAEANVSKTEILKKVEEATEEVKVSKKALEEALSRVEAANCDKLAVEEALRKWRSEHALKRRFVHNPTTFKNSYPSQHRRDSCLLALNGLNLVSDELKPVLQPTISIGQILSRKLLLTEDFENGMYAEKSTWRRKVSLAQMLSKPNAESHSVTKAGKENNHGKLPAKRKKFSFVRISILATKQSKKKKKQTARSGCRGVSIN